VSTRGFFFGGLGDVVKSMTVTSLPRVCLTSPAWSCSNRLRLDVGVNEGAPDDEELDELDADLDEELDELDADLDDELDELDADLDDEDELGADLDDEDELDAELDDADELDAELDDEDERDE